VIDDDQSHVYGGIVNIVNSKTANCNNEDIKLVNTDVVKVAFERCLFNARELLA
jgi:hypothetical protein